MPTVTGFPHPPVSTGVCRFIVMFMALVSLSACAPATQADEELRKEIQALKEQVTAMQEKLNQVQTGQQVMLELLKTEVDQMPQAVTELLARLDAFLKTFLVSGDFLWEEELKDGFPKDTYWYLYGRLPQELKLSGDY